MGTLYNGDKLDILTRTIADESVDLVYLDPPFNSAQTYNAFFQEKDGTSIGVLISIKEPNSPCANGRRTPAPTTSAFNAQKYPRIELRTIEQLMADVAIERPSSNVALDETFKNAPKAKAKDDGQQGLQL